MSEAWCHPGFTGVFHLVHCLHDLLSNGGIMFPESAMHITPYQVSRWYDFRKEHNASDSDVPLTQEDPCGLAELPGLRGVWSPRLWGLVDLSWESGQAAEGEASSLPGTVLSAFLVLTQKTLPALWDGRWGTRGPGSQAVSSVTHWVGCEPRWMHSLYDESPCTGDDRFKWQCESWKKLK